MNTLITGGTGFVGAELTRMLIEKGERPIIFDVAPVREPLKRHSDGFEYMPGAPWPVSLMGAE